MNIYHSTFGSPCHSLGSFLLLTSTLILLYNPLVSSSAAARLYVVRPTCALRFSLVTRHSIHLSQQTPASAYSYKIMSSYTAIHTLLIKRSNHQTLEICVGYHLPIAAQKGWAVHVDEGLCTSTSHRLSDLVKEQGSI